MLLLKSSVLNELLVDPSFQILHALYILEKFLQDLLKREAVFDVVFFDGTADLLLCRLSFTELSSVLELRHPTISGGSSRYSSASRGLARVLLFNHLEKHKDTIGLDVYVFEDLGDPAWKDYQRRVRV